MPELSAPDLPTPPRPPAPDLPVPPLRYHEALVEHLRTHEAELFAWFEKGGPPPELGETVRLELLKSTYRLEPAAHPALHEAARDAAARLGVLVPIHLYQGPNVGTLNASLAYLPEEAHLVLHGPVVERLTPAELRAVMGHELLHHALLAGWSDFRVASQLLAALANDAQGSPAHAASARLLALYTEVYCDRGGLVACGELAAAVSALVKIETGLAEVSADGFQRQAEEIFARGHPRTQGVTHPETFVRARALRLWAESPERAAAELRGVIEGPLELAELDLLGQRETAALTRRLVAGFLRPAWLRTDPLLAHARLFFEELAPAEADDPGLAGELAARPGLTDYACYVLLDFATADRDLEDAPLAAAWLAADALGLGERFRALAAKELGLRKKQLEALEAGAAGIVAAAERAEREP